MRTKSKHEIREMQKHRNIVGNNFDESKHGYVRQLSTTSAADKIRTYCLYKYVMYMINKTVGTRRASPRRADAPLGSAHARSYRGCIVGKSRPLMRLYCVEVHPYLLMLLRSDGDHMNITCYACFSLPRWRPSASQAPPASPIPQARATHARRVIGERTGRISTKLGERGATNFHPNFPRFFSLHLRICSPFCLCTTPMLVLGFIAATLWLCHFVLYRRSW